MDDMEKLDPQLLAEILALQQTGQWTGANTGGNLNGVQQWYDPNVEGNNGWRLQYQPGVQYGSPNGGDTLDPRLDQRWISKVREDTGGKIGDRWSLDGTYQGTFEAQDGGGRDMNQAIAMILGGYFGGGGAEGWGAGGWNTGLSSAGEVGGSAASAGLSSADKAAMFGAEGYGAGMTGAETAAFGSGAGGAGSALSNIGSQVVDAGTKAANGLNAGGVLGALAGAATSKDQEQTTSRDPWGPAKPYLEGLLREGNDLYQQYKTSPFSDSQKAGYNNMAGLLDLVNRNAGGLLSGFQANASGANQFQRGKPGLLQGSTFNPSPTEWNPQSYGRFGG